MATVDEGIETRIAANIRARREELGLSLGQLAERSGVSKAMIAKVESCASSPTAALLGRLCAGLGVTMSSLMAAAEGNRLSFFPAAHQPSWSDPETGLVRTLVAPSSPESAVEIARLRLPQGAFVEYPMVPSRQVRQHILGVTGTLRFTIGGEATSIAAGDCLFAIIDRPTRLESIGPGHADYYVIQETA
jgi:transcriptional regulator with XRE-family HTH domain